MASQQQCDTDWTPVPALPSNTFGWLGFTVYCLVVLSLGPFYVPVFLMAWIFEYGIMGCLHKVMFWISDSMVQPIPEVPSSIVLITGAASGIGKEQAKLYAAKGFSLTLIDISEDPLVSLGEELSRQYRSQSFKTIVCDLSKRSAAGEILKECSDQNIEILVNNAGFGYTGEFVNQNIGTLQKMNAVNIDACLGLAQGFARRFIKKGRGRICQIASCAAYSPCPHAAAYHGTKAYMRHFSLALREELRNTGVTVTVVCPGAVRTNFASASKANRAMIFTSLSWFSYRAEEIAKWAVDGTLKGTPVVDVGPLWSALQYYLSYYGETFAMISGRFCWQDPSKDSRSIFEQFVYQKQV